MASRISTNNRLIPRNPQSKSAQTPGYRHLDQGTQLSGSNYVPDDASIAPRASATTPGSSPLASPQSDDQEDIYDDELIDTDLPRQHKIQASEVIYHS